jgi:hypothetical protein
MSAINSYGNEADIAALNAKVRDIRMAEIHEQIMDEMLNGEDRRRKHAEDTEYERHLAAALQHTQQQAMQQNIQNAILRIESTGNVGIGNVTPSTQLGGVIGINRGE